MWDKVGAKNRGRPLLLRADNFTPPSRTPWGGRRIVDDLKRELGLRVAGAVGEAWELSVEPDFPSRLEAGPSLDEVLREEPSLLGDEAKLGSTALLVKLVDAADDLSVQIHPDDADPALEDDESGKPEAWYIVDAEPGAGLYLGFREGVSREDVEEAIDGEGRVDALMCFVPVERGDVFAIDPGTPHAVGRGVLLLEPQRVAPGKRGITYRYWDWNRRYDADGRRDPNGKPRALHRERALDVTRWKGPREAALLDEIRFRSGPVDTASAARVETLAGPDGPLRTDVFAAWRLSGSGEVELPPRRSLGSLTVLEGRVTLEGTAIERGRTAALPARRDGARAQAHGAHAIVCTLA